MFGLPVNGHHGPDPVGFQRRAKTHLRDFDSHIGVEPLNRVVVFEPPEEVAEQRNLLVIEANNAEAIRLKGSAKDPLPQRVERQRIELVEERMRLNAREEILL
jgi:hypothetical protein